MPHPKQHISDLAAICQKKGLQHVVISPGSRSAPLIRSFYGTFGSACVSIVDERSAGYFALGLAVYLQKPVGLICTSGTAVLNYAPALAEAYYQQIPLLAITADRPNEWIDQQDNQTIRQNGIYRNFTKRSYTLPQYMVSEDDLWYVHRSVNEAFDLCMQFPRGPVQINVPLTEPLYDELPPFSATLRIITCEQHEIRLKLSAELLSEWKAARRIMIVHGQGQPNPELDANISLLLKDKRIVIVSENIANLPNKEILSNSNLVLSTHRSKSPEYPDLLLYSGGQVVSKALTGYLRRADQMKCWRIGNDNNIIDTFKMVTRLLPYPAGTVYHALAESGSSDVSAGYRSQWLNLASESDKLAEINIKQSPFTDTSVFRMALGKIPRGTNLVLGNSSVIRYSQLFPAQEKINYFSNRGVSGIDGCLSTAAGIAFASKKLTIAIVGDLGFLYDSNALWNRELPSNLRILVVNNQGGGIFHILKGPSEQPGFKKFIEANHPVNIAKLAEAYGLKYLFAGDEQSLSGFWPEFIAKQQVSVLFEVKTDAGTSASAFRKLMAGTA